MMVWAALELRQGRVHHPQAQGLATAEVADRLWASGVRGLHLVDLDAAQGGRNQWHVAAPFVGRGFRIQYGGGVRSMTQVQQLRDLGVDRVVVSTQGLRHPLWLRELCHIFPQRIVLGLDERDGHLVIDGRGEALPADAAATARGLDDAGLLAFHLTTLDGSPDPAAMRGLRTPVWLTMAEHAVAGAESSGIAGGIIEGVALDGEPNQVFTARPEPPMPRPRPRRLVQHQHGGEEEE